MADSHHHRPFCTALAALLALGLAGPSAAAANPFLADSGTSPSQDESQKPQRSEPSKQEQGSQERCGGWESKSDRDPMTPPENPELGKCGRCFGGDD
jgi:hypothetical protein